MLVGIDLDNELDLTNPNEVIRALRQIANELEAFSYDPEEWIDGATSSKDADFSFCIEPKKDISDVAYIFKNHEGVNQ